MGEPHKYGKWYYCVKSNMSKNKDIYAYADKTVITDAGNLLLLNDNGTINLAFAPGKWDAIYAASCWDGHAVAVEHWAGEVESL